MTTEYARESITFVESVVPSESYPSSVWAALPGLFSLDALARIPLDFRAGSGGPSLRPPGSHNPINAAVPSQEGSQPTPAGICLARLSLREREVLHWATAGKTNREIATILGITPLTAKKHLERIFSKLEVHSRTALLLTYPQPHHFEEMP